MIIQCDHCQSQFRIADEKVPPQGARVNCPNCRNKFVVRRASGDLPSSDDVPSPGYMPGDIAAREAGWLPSGDPAPDPPPGPGPQQAAAQAGPQPVQYPPGPPDAPSDPWQQESQPPQVPEPDPGGGAPLPWETDSQAPEPLPDTSRAPSRPATGGRDELLGSDPPPDPPAAPPQPPPQPARPPQAPPQPPQGPPQEPASSGLELAIEKPQPHDDFGSFAPPEPGEQSGARPIPRAAQRSGPRPVVSRIMRAPAPPRIAFRFLLGSFFMLSVLGLYGALTDMTFQPSALPIGQAQASSARGLAMSGPEARYADQQPDQPPVFVLRAEVRNTSAHARTRLHVRGRLFDDADHLLAELEVPCGNSFSRQQLLQLQSADDVQKAYTPLGDNLSNKRIEPGESIQCTVVFYDAPDAYALARYELAVSQATDL